MDRNWRGGEFRFGRYQGRLGDGVVAELRRRYDGWLVRQEVDSDDDGTLVFSPLLSEHRLVKAAG